MRKWRIIDLVRSFSILAVLACHSQFLSAGWGRPDPAWARLWARLSANGAYGVYLFFVASGFLITHVIAQNPGGLFRPALRTFYVQRIGRIWPLFFLCVWFGFLIHGATPPPYARYVDNFSIIPGTGILFWLSILTFTFNWMIALYGFAGLHWSVLWSLAVEEQFYALYPLVLAKVKDRKNLLWVLGAIILLGPAWRTALYFLRPGNEIIQLAPSPAQFDMIAIGILLYLVVQRYGPALARRQALSLALCLLGVVILVLSYTGTDLENGLDRIYASSALGAGLFLFLLGGLHLSFFESPLWWIPSLPGKYCYGSYLLHPTLLTLFKFYLESFPPWAAFSLFALLTTAFSALSFHLFELPVNTMIRKRFIPKT